MLDRLRPLCLTVQGDFLVSSVKSYSTTRYSEDLLSALPKTKKPRRLGAGLFRREGLELLAHDALQLVRNKKQVRKQEPLWYELCR